jgi:two-component system, NtrC family, response regulator HydG
LAKNRLRVLVVDDNLEMARALGEGLDDHGYEGVAVTSGAEAIARLEAGGIGAVVTDLRMPSVDGLAVLEASRRLEPSRPVIIMTAFSAIDSAVESIRRGANHYLTKPFKQEELIIFLGRALEEVRLRREAAALKRELGGRLVAKAIVGDSAPIRALRELVSRVADAPVPILIQGETGTGKGLVARAIHGESGRAGKSFVAVNCAAIPEGLLESELFGYVRGAFTGATHDRAGLFAEASGGTLFLDEIGEMSPALQAKLLHVIEAASVRPVGGTREVAVDARIVAATNRNLAAADPLEFRGEILPIRELQRRYAAWALTQTGGHRARAAEKLGIDVKTLRGWLE